MPKPRLHTNKYVLHGLKLKIEQKVHFKLNNIKACEKLSCLIFNKIGENISSITLYRLFLKNSAEHRPYKHTLDILSIFVNASTWEKLQNELNDIIQFKFQLGFCPNYEQNLLGECIKFNAYQPIQAFFDKISPENFDLYKEFLGDSIYDGLLKNTEKENLVFFKQFSGNEVVRLSFYEFLADPDFKIKGYEEGLKLYFNQSKKENHIIGLQDRVFAQSLLLRNAFLKNKRKDFETSTKYLYDDDYFEKEINQIHLFPRFRYKCYRLFLLATETPALLDNEIDSIFDYIRNTLKKEYISVGLSRIIIHTFGDTLHLINKFSIENKAKLEKLFPLTFESIPQFYKRLSNEDFLALINPNASAFWNSYRINKAL